MARQTRLEPLTLLPRLPPAGDGARVAVRGPRLPHAGVVQSVQSVQSVAARRRLARAAAAAALARPAVGPQRRHRRQRQQRTAPGHAVDADRGALRHAVQHHARLRQPAGRRRAAGVLVAGQPDAGPLRPRVPALELAGVGADAVALRAAARPRRERRPRRPGHPAAPGRLRRHHPAPAGVRRRHPHGPRPHAAGEALPRPAAPAAAQLPAAGRRRAGGDRGPVHQPAPPRPHRLLQRVHAHRDAGARAAPPPAAAVPGPDGLRRRGGRRPAHHRTQLPAARVPLPAPLRAHHRRRHQVRAQLLLPAARAERVGLQPGDGLRPVRAGQAGGHAAVPVRRQVRSGVGRGPQGPQPAVLQTEVPERPRLRGRERRRHHGAGAVLPAPPRPGHRQVRRERLGAPGARRELPEPQEAERARVRAGDGPRHPVYRLLLPRPAAAQHPGLPDLAGGLPGRQEVLQAVYHRTHQPGFLLRPRQTQRYIFKPSLPKVCVFLKPFHTGKIWFTLPNLYIFN